ncbi:MAG: molybdopterin dinucleotide binding domain-containing protein, partial [Enterobacteriaceae bacterium]
DTAGRQHYPLQMIGFHCKGHVHSTYYSVAMLREAIPHECWLNPVDAQHRGINEGDRVEIFNERGKIRMAVKVTPRVMPGVLAVPQGAWRNINADGVDVGGCINTLTTQHPSPLAKGNPQHTNLVDIKRVE